MDSFQEKAGIRTARSIHLTLHRVSAKLFLATRFHIIKIRDFYKCSHKTPAAWKLIQMHRIHVVLSAASVSPAFYVRNTVVAGFM